jgi:hypothetical protein
MSSIKVLFFLKVPMLCFARQTPPSHHLMFYFIRQPTLTPFFVSSFVTTQRWLALQRKYRTALEEGVNFIIIAILS